MKRIFHAGGLFTAAVFLTLIGLAWSALLLAREPAFRRQQKRQITLENKLRVLENDAGALEALRQAFVAVGNGVNVNQQTKDIFGNDPAADIRIETATSSKPFRLHPVTVDYAFVVFETLTARIRAAEALRPPLKLTACVLEAAPGKTGEGHARLTFERIEWQ